MKTYKVTVDGHGNISWYKEGTTIRHREDGPAVENSNGTKCWWVNDQRHRVGGPAVVWKDGSESYYQFDKYHREDGPARTDLDGTKRWYLNGEEYSEEQFNKKVNPSSCEGKVVEIEGKKYKLVSL